MSRYTGTVKWFNNAKGYGFLGRNDGGADVFAHFSAIHKNGYKTLKEGEPVSFDIVQGEKGRPQAADITPLAADTSQSNARPVSSALSRPVAAERQSA